MAMRFYFVGNLPLIDTWPAPLTEWRMIPGVCLGSVGKATKRLRGVLGRIQCPARGLCVSWACFLSTPPLPTWLLRSAVFQYLGSQMKSSQPRKHLHFPVCVSDSTSIYQVIQAVRPTFSFPTFLPVLLAIRSVSSRRKGRRMNYPSSDTHYSRCLHIFEYVLCRCSSHFFVHWVTVFVYFSVL